MVAKKPRHWLIIANCSKPILVSKVLKEIGDVLREVVMNKKVSNNLSCSHSISNFFINFKKSVS